ncbi:glycosyltransferase family 2 protein [Vibrio vulnificus]
MKYTIAIPAYNNADIIDKAIESCLNQNFDYDYEVLVSDDGSTDNSHEVYQNYLNHPSFKLVKHEKNSSLYENHNRCLRASSSEYVLFCHADDELFDDALLKLDAALKKINYPKRIVCWGRSFFRDFNSAYSRVSALNEIVSGKSAQELFQHGGLTPSGTCYSRASFLESGGFLPMRNKITPSDMTSMIKYSLDGAEFLMLDRLLFKREFASTACWITQEDGFESVEHAIEELARVLSPKTMETLFNNIETFTTINLNYMLVLSKYSSNDKLKNKFKVKFILKHPFSLRNKFTRKLVFKK